MKGIAVPNRLRRHGLPATAAEGLRTCPQHELRGATAGAVIAYGDPDQVARASEQVSHLLGRSAVKPAPAEEPPRGPYAPGAPPQRSQGR